MPEDLFYESHFTMRYILWNKINEILLVDTCITRYGFIDKNFAEIINQPNN